MFYGIVFRFSDKKFNKTVNFIQHVVKVLYLGVEFQPLMWNLSLISVISALYQSQEQRQNFHNVGINNVSFRATNLLPLFK